MHFSCTIFKHLQCKYQHIFHNSSSIDAHTPTPLWAYYSHPLAFDKGHKVLSSSSSSTSIQNRLRKREDQNQGPKFLRIQGLDNQVAHLSRPRFGKRSGGQLYSRTKPMEQPR